MVPPQQIQSIRDQLGLAPETTLLTMIAEFIPRKRHDLVLRAMADCAEPVHLALVGTGELVPRVMDQASSLGISDRVHFLGWRGDVPSILAASQATVLFSAHEGLPRSTMESMSMGKPVIGSDIRGLRDLLSDGCGILVPSGDVAGLTKAMDTMARDCAMALKMGSAGRERVKSDYEIGPLLEAQAMDSANQFVAP